MAHHKKKRAWHQRASCGLCKGHYKDERGKNGFNAQSMQAKRVLQDELPLAPRKSRRKDTLKWCRGKAGQAHNPVWVDKGHFWHHFRRELKWLSSWRLCCQDCGKELGEMSRWRREEPIHIRKFPGWERFKDGPPAE